MRPVVFSDLDGTLLDHATYAYDEAKPALNVLRRLDIPLILASSKTSAEIKPLHQELALERWPAIVENGAGAFIPGSDAGDDDQDYQRLRQTIATLPALLSKGFIGFGDMSDLEVADQTGLPLEQARLARMRHYSEPGIWTGSEVELARFLETLRSSGVSARQGGRFLTLSFGHSKAERMPLIADLLGADLTIALGDAPNDVEMLEAADYGVIVRNDHAARLPRLSKEKEGRIRRTLLSGPAGWNAAILDLVEELGMN